ncbi:MAG TPA: polymer-forming cytoskeletal protein [Gemmatimonadales bacterium]|nr:polymer-forming cytoskeletal protein [Gemmatimonadales bacterium]
MAIFTRTTPTGRPETSARRGEPAGLTIIATGTTVVGDIATEGVIKVEGTIEGTVRAATQLLVAPGAVIRGDVHGAEIVAGGEIHGAVQADERVEIQAGAVIYGDIRTLRLHIADGGKVNGQITMEPAGQEQREHSSVADRSEIL